MFLLHAHGGDEHLPDFVNEIFIHGIEEVAVLIPLLFLTYLLIEYIGHRAKSHAVISMERAGALAPVFGGLAGAFPQCGFSAVASSLYAGRMITLGTLIAVFLSTSDEMLPILISGSLSPLAILAIVGYKTAAAILCGVIIDLVYRRGKRPAEASCHTDCCHCEDDGKHGGILRHAIRHTLKISVFVLVVTFAINAAVYFIGEDGIGALIPSIPFLGHIVAAIFGLIPNCAPSVVLTKLATGGIISAGQMMSGLFSGAGVGLAVLLRQSRSKKDNFMIILILVVLGAVLGFLADIIMPGLLAWA